MGQPKYYSVEQVLKELQIDHEQLQKLISEGEITPQREGNRFKFLESDILQYKAQRMESSNLIANENNDVDIIEQITGNEGEIITADADDIVPTDEVQPLLNLSNDVDEKDAQLEEQFEALLDMGKDAVQEELPESSEDEKNILKEMEDERLHAADNPMDFAQLDEQPVEVSEDSIEEANDKNASGVPSDQMLEISDQELDDAYLADLQKEIKENDTGELKFENVEGESFMETGEVLSESAKDRRLPADKDVEELFANEFDGNENFKSQTHIKDEVDLNEEPGNDEDVLGVAKTEFEGAGSEIPGSKTKVLVGVILLALLGGIGSSFVFWDPLQILGFSGKPVNVIQASLENINAHAEVIGEVGFLEIPVQAANKGQIQEMAEIDKNLEQGTQLFKILVENLEYNTLVLQKQELEQAPNNLLAAQKAYTSFVAIPTNKNLPTIQKNLQSKDPKIKNATFAALQKEPYKTLYPKYLELYNAYLAANKAKQEAGPKLKAVNEQLKTTKQFSEVVITAPENGKVKTWFVRPNSPVTPDTVVATFQSNIQMNVALPIPKEDANNYSVGTTATFLHAGQDLSFIVQKADEIDDLVKIATVIAMTDSQTLSKDTNDQYCFAYPKSVSAVVLPKDVIYSEGSNSYILLAREGKVAKQNIQVQPIWKDESKVLAKGINDKDWIIVTKDPELKEGIRVKVDIK